MYKKISIIGNGGMGTVLAMMLCDKGLSVRMWGYDAEQLGEMAAAGENVKFFPGYKIPAGVEFEADDSKIFADTDMVISAVPCQYMRGVWDRLKSQYVKGVPIVSVTKGIENGTLLRPTEILSNVLGDAVDLVVLSGPTIADELARRLPASACIACKDARLAVDVQYTFNTDWFRVYTNPDVIGVEIAAACKNVIAIAAGIIDGVGGGDNAKAALLSRALAEVTRLGVACGAEAKTFAGLAGLGDLVTTCISPKGRNRSFGERIGKGMTTQQSLGATYSVVEGASTCKSLFEFAGKYEIEMPITEAVYQILFEEKPVREAITELMTRQLKSE